MDFDEGKLKPTISGSNATGVTETKKDGTKPSIADNSNSGGVGAASECSGIDERRMSTSMEDEEDCKRFKKRKDKDEHGASRKDEIFPKNKNAFEGASNAKLSVGGTAVSTAVSTSTIPTTTTASMASTVTSTCTTGVSAATTTMASAATHETAEEEESFKCLGSPGGPKVPPLKIVIPPIESEQGNRNGKTTTRHHGGLPYVVASNDETGATSSVSTSSPTINQHSLVKDEECAVTAVTLSNDEQKIQQRVLRSTHSNRTATNDSAGTGSNNYDTSSNSGNNNDVNRYSYGADNSHIQPNCGGNANIGYSITVGGGSNNVNSSAGSSSVGENTSTRDDFISTGGNSGHNSSNSSGGNNNNNNNNNDSTDNNNDNSNSINGNSSSMAISSGNAAGATTSITIGCTSGSNSTSNTVIATTTATITTTNVNSNSTSNSNNNNSNNNNSNIGGSGVGHAGSNMRNCGNGTTSGKGERNCGDSNSSSTGAGGAAISGGGSSSSSSSSSSSNGSETSGNCSPVTSEITATNDVSCNADGTSSKEDCGGNAVKSSKIDGSAVATKSGAKLDSGSLLTATGIKMKSETNTTTNKLSRMDTDEDGCSKNISNNCETRATTSVSAAATETHGKDAAAVPVVELHPRKRKLKSKQEINHTTAEADHSMAFGSTPHPHEVPVTNCYQMFMDIRRQIDVKRKGLFPIQPKPPQGFKDYLMNRCTYTLAGNAIPRLKRRNAEPPETIDERLKDLYQEQEAERYSLRMQHVVEKEKLVLSVEQEILRVHGRAARALANQALPFSACTILKDEEVYNVITPEQEEKDRNARSRYNGRLFISWLQDVDDKWEKIKEEMLARHHKEAESLNAVQKFNWDLKMRQLGLWKKKNCAPVDESSVPMISVSDDFDLLPE